MYEHRSRNNLIKPLEEITIHDLSYLSTISYEECGTRLYNGRTLTKYKMVETLKTSVGDFDEKKWTEIAKYIVERDNLSTLYAACVEHCKSLVFLSPEEYEYYALSCMTHDAWKYWDNFKF